MLSLHNTEYNHEVLTEVSRAVFFFFVFLIVRFVLKFFFELHQNSRYNNNNNNKVIFHSGYKYPTARNVQQLYTE